MDIMKVLIIVLPAFFFGVRGQDAEMITMGGVSLLAVAMLDFKDIKSISALGVKLENFERAIEKANVTIEKLRDVTSPLSAYVLVTIQGNDDIGYKETIDVINKINAANEDLDDPAVREILSKKDEIIYNKFKYAFMFATEGLSDHNVFHRAVTSFLDKQKTPRELRDFIEKEDIAHVAGSSARLTQQDYEKFRNQALPVLEDYEKFWNT
ncbi:hypothetical protein [Listeria ivanovii]|uniref:Uncharacterized protein n=2 Tax=Listeria ivanovii TaxID=1638 RepID=A0ABS1G237_LISIV|nr:hypothetical protein [Listeria ivanovii]AIS58601.1 hypothetical protein JL58_00720 [Listeria ivanovii subsp. londoniensis]MBK1960875.1 hypothetical protein [Listeria ivanovii subsp. londoniensis]MBM5608789.1 hypothetical protein [Listeria ivanovii]MBM5636949.1 hypothetical protein [Listeria ivanovii]MBM5706550.1 hypothetical protein [Listeria ivanovii]